MGDLMLKKDVPHEQFDLFGISTVLKEPKKVKPKLSPEERAIRKEIEEAHTAWKLLKSNRFNELLTERHKYLLRKHYKINL
jgi:hypothetical protein